MKNFERVHLLTSQGLTALLLNYARWQSSCEAFVITSQEELFLQRLIRVFLSALNYYQILLST